MCEIAVAKKEKDSFLAFIYVDTIPLGATDLKLCQDF